MGQNERAAEDRKQSRRDRTRQGRSKRAAEATGVQLRTVDWRSVAALVVAFAENSGAVRIGYSRDGGALAIGCYLGDDYATEYIRPAEDLEAALLEIAEAWLPERGIAYHQLYQEFHRRE